MMIAHPVDGGLGDCISQSFIPRRGWANERVTGLSRMLALWRSHRATVVGVCYHKTINPNPAVGELFAALGLRLLEGPEKFACYSPGELSGIDLSKWVLSTTLAEPEDVEPTLLPVRQPGRPIPRSYILFNELAGKPDRNLGDRNIYRAIKEAYPGVPVVKVGRGASRIDCDIDLTNLTTAPETFWLAKHARLIVSAETFFRCFAAIFGKRVVELLDERRALPDTILRNEMDHRIGAYGMTPELNRSFIWPAQAADMRAHIGTSTTS